MEWKTEVEIYPCTIYPKFQLLVKLPYLHLYQGVHEYFLVTKIYTSIYLIF